MHKFMMAACAAMLALCVTGAVRADKSETLAQWEQKLPRQSELKIKDGTSEGHKTPLEVALRAIRAAKSGKLAELKVCLETDARDSADQNSYLSEGKTNLQEIGARLALYSEEGLKAVAQNTVGNYALVMATSPRGVHMLRMELEAQELPAKEGEEAQKGPKNWYLCCNAPAELELDVNAPEVRQLIEAINKGDHAKVREFIDPWETRGLDFLAGAKEGCDPFEMLVYRLRKVINNGNGKPVMLMNRYSTEVAFWFSSESADTFIVVQFGTELNWETKRVTTQVKLAFNSSAMFHAEAGSQFKGWTNDWDWD